MITIQTPYVQFTELDGSPLDDGAVYIGTAGLNPQTNPITVYWDNAGTQPAAQPLTTRSGVIARNGAPARVYISASSYSLMVRDKRGGLVASELSITSSVDASGITDGTITEVKLDAALVAKINGALQTTGGTMTGAIVLPGNATNALEAVPKQQAESIATSAVADRMRVSLTASQATTSGTAIDFTGIPSWAKRVTVQLNQVSTNGSSAVNIQLGTSSGPEVSGYIGSASYISGAGSALSNNLGTGATIPLTAATAVRSGAITFTKLSGNVWVFSGSFGDSGGTNVVNIAGVKALGSDLDRVRLTTVGAIDAFDLGSASILIEG